MKGEQCRTYIKLVGEAIRFSFAQHQQGRSVQRSSSLLVKPSAFPSRIANKGETFIKLVGEAIRFSFAQHQQGRNHEGWAVSNVHQALDSTKNVFRLMHSTFWQLSVSSKGPKSISSLFSVRLPLTQIPRANKDLVQTAFRSPLPHSLETVEK